ncbi:LysR family transcriptional regulator [Williamsia sterculiae]|uniref:DNA-binding transcriptional regulator, LysR family n=1 Tax=Williamsia sterculiae TaxID=1344003 RepID=A0A1N7GEP8_9NOCA|nr:LysR family transcriptional regulator [Williamsia sterculiae]SIS11053.1 DNA-binding transcriptional regulator, LysR family [Williamsia sterculiae]
MSPTLDITPLRSLVAVATYGGFHRAAVALHLTQSAVSQHVRRLESETGAALVERVGRVSRFTDAGDVLLGEARIILAAHDRAVERMQVPVPRTITVATTEHAADRVVPALAALLRARLPEETVRFRLDRSDRVAAAHANGDADVAIYLDGVDDRPPPDERAGADAVRIPVVWLGATDFTLDDEPLPVALFDAPCALREPIVDVLRQADRDHQVVCETPDLAGLQSVVRAGVAVTMLPVVDGVPEGLRMIGALPVPPPFVLRVKVAERLPADTREAVLAAVADIAEQSSTGRRARVRAVS